MLACLECIGAKVQNTHVWQIYHNCQAVSLPGLCALLLLDAYVPKLEALYIAGIVLLLKFFPHSHFRPGSKVQLKFAPPPPPPPPPPPHLTELPMLSRKLARMIGKICTYRIGGCRHFIRVGLYNNPHGWHIGGA